MAESTTAHLLKGVRVLSLAGNVPGPVAAFRLQRMGAEVTKVEPLAGDPLVAASPGWYAALTAGQHVLRLDLKEPGDRAALDALLTGSDLLLTATRPAALERLSLGWAQLREHHPALCCVAITGYAPPDENLAGHDLTYQAAAGLLRPPGLPLTLLADLAAAERTVSTALALLFARERTGQAGYAQVAIADAVAGFAEPLHYGLTQPGGLLGGGLPIYGLYAASDGWVALAALEPHFAMRLAEELALRNLERNELEEVFRTRTAAEWEQWAAERDLPIAAVRPPQPLESQ
jgi:alpha-methylacyl-CoA racemase